jgi:hypothetical protein
MRSFRQYIAEENVVVAYHGTDAPNISRFDADKARADADVLGGQGAYFTPNRDVAINYAKSAKSRQGSTKLAHLYTVKLKFNKLFDATNLADFEKISREQGGDVQAVKYLKSQGYDGLVYEIPEKTGEVAAIKIRWSIPKHLVYISYNTDNIQITANDPIEKDEIKRVVNQFNKPL